MRIVASLTFNNTFKTKGCRKNYPFCDSLIFFFSLNVEIIGKACDPQDLHHFIIDVLDRKTALAAEQIIGVQDRSQRG